jgi:hypothetical protein
VQLAEELSLQLAKTQKLSRLAWRHVTPPQQILWLSIKSECSGRKPISLATYRPLSYRYSKKFLLSPRAPASVTPVKLAAVVKFRPRCRFAYIQSSSMILHIFAKHGLILDSATADQQRVELCCSQSASLDSLVICSWQMAKSHAHGSACLA